MNIEQLKTVTSAQVGEINSLLRQLAHDPAAFHPVAFEALEKIFKNEELNVFVARDGEKIIGTATLIALRTLSGYDGEIDDVVVDENYRGQGIGEKLMKTLIEQAQNLGLRHIELSSRPARIAANKLYQKMGFEPKETNVYRLKL